MVPYTYDVSLTNFSKLARRIPSFQLCHCDQLISSILDFTVYWISHPGIIMCICRNHFRHRMRVYTKRERENTLEQSLPKQRIFQLSYIVSYKIVMIALIYFR